MSKKRRNGHSESNGHNENGNGHNENGNGHNEILTENPSKYDQYNNTSKTEVRRQIKLIANSEEQREAIRLIKENQITFIHGLAGTGKAQPLDSIVYTPDGPRKMGDLKVGDSVCTPNGGISKVSGIFPQGKKMIYRICFADGDFVDSCAEHLWQIYDNRWGSKKNKKDWSEKPRIMDTMWIRSNMFEKGGRSRFKIAVPKEVLFTKREVKIDPYLLGVILGDGCTSRNKVVISTADEEICDNIRKVLLDGYQLIKPPSQKYEYCIKRIKTIRKENDYVALLKEYGLMGKTSEHKHIPDEYKYNTKEIRLSIIQGIMDTDGYISDGRAEISITSEKMAHDIKEIISSLGGVCSVKTRTSWYTYKGEKKIGMPVYRCYIKHNNPEELFKLTRKKRLAVKRTTYPVRRVIRDIVQIGEQEAQCILIDSNEHLYLTNNCVITHNTYLSVMYGLRELLFGNYDKLIFTRPCVEANGERLGMLPGGYDDKIAPYMIPIFDIIADKIPLKSLKKLMEDGKIKTLPLAYLRGVTFNNSYVVADEAQNTNPQQMRLLLTRIGKDSKMVITGDLSQTDITGRNGLRDAIDKLVGIKDISSIELTEKSMARNALITLIEEKYSQI